MANFFNDLNKLVNTVQKVDRLLSEKPKQKLINISLSQKEIRTICEWFSSSADQDLWDKHNETGYPTKQEIDMHNKIYAKLRKRLRDF